MPLEMERVFWSLVHYCEPAELNYFDIHTSMEEIAIEMKPPITVEVDKRKKSAKKQGASTW